MLLSLLLASAAHAACNVAAEPNASCNDVCSDFGGVWGCAFPNASAAAEIWLAYGPANTGAGPDACDGYCAWGTDPDGSAFCCELPEAQLTTQSVSVYGTYYADKIHLGDGNGNKFDKGPSYVSYAPDVLVSTYDGDDIVTNVEGRMYLSFFAGPGNDYADCSASPQGVNLVGFSGDDVLIGGPSYDAISGSEGNDEIYGNDGDDFLDGSQGNDQLYGGLGADGLDGGGGRDKLYGGGGGDLLVGGDGNDKLSGGNGNDQICGDLGTDDLLGGAGSDRLQGGDGADTEDGGADLNDRCEVMSDPGCEALISGAFTCPDPWDWLNQ